MLHAEEQRCSSFRSDSWRGLGQPTYKDAGMVMKLNYSRCLTTEDGEFLLPDGVYTIPRKSSKVDQYADVFMHWNNNTSTLSNSINVHSGLNLGDYSVSGKFS